MANTYVDCIAYTKAPTGIVLAPFIGNIGRIASSNAGATSLTLPTNQAITAAALSQYDNLYIFDGPNSEVVQIGSSGTGIGATTIPLQAGTQYAHLGGTPFCTDGAQGSLGEQIFTASRWIEDEICFQALWSTTYTGEILTAPTMRAALDNQRNLHFRPRHFPISALSSVTVKTNALNATTYDPAQAIIDADQQTVDLALMAALSSGSSQITQNSPWLADSLSRSTNAWITISYTAGFAVGSLPRPVVRACTLLTSSCFVQLDNPTGADSIQQNKRNVTFVIRGDLVGESLLVKEAKRLLSPYVIQSF